MDPPGRLVVGGREFLLETFTTTLDVAAGAHIVMASLADHRDQQLDVIIEPGQGYALDIRLERVFGSVIVATIPPGVRVSVDGEYAGETVPSLAPRGPSEPVFVTDLMPGQHQLRLERPCSAPQTLPFNIPDPPVDADLGVVELEAAVATADVVSPIPGATVYVDGRLRGRAAAAGLDDIWRRGAGDSRSARGAGRFLDRPHVAGRRTSEMLRAEFPAGPSCCWPAGAARPGATERTLAADRRRPSRTRSGVLVTTPGRADLAAVAGADERCIPLSVWHADGQTRPSSRRRRRENVLSDALTHRRCVLGDAGRSGAGERSRCRCSRADGVPRRSGCG